MSEQDSKVSYDNEVYIFECPHCKDLIMVNIREVNCQIFRHAQYKSNGIQINPHATKEECDYYINNNLIYGCGKPFKILEINNEFQTEICEYI